MGSRVFDCTGETFKGDINYISTHNKPQAVPSNTIKYVGDVEQKEINSMKVKETFFTTKEGNLVILATTIVAVLLLLNM